MTPEERYAENERLAYWTIHKFYPDYAQDEDMLQIAKLALWKSCLMFDENAGNSFATYAVKAIKLGVIHELKKRRTYAKKSEVSLDSKVRALDSDVPLVDTIPSKFDEYEQMENNDFVNDVLSRLKEALTEEQLFTLEMFEQTGMNYSKTGKIIGITHQAVHYRIRSIRKKLLKIMERELQ